MNAPVLDTLRCTQTLKAAGFRNEQAVAPPRGDFAKLHERIDRLERRLNKRFDGLDKRLKVIPALSIVNLAAMFALIFGAIVAPNISWG